MKKNASWGICLLALLGLLIGIPALVMAIIEMLRTNYHWWVTGNTRESLTADDVTDVLIPCTNLSWGFQRRKINSGKSVEFFLPCPASPNTCLDSICGGDGVCRYDLAEGSECSLDSQCRTLYNNTAGICGEDCLCTNISFPSPSGEWIEFNSSLTSPDITFSYNSTVTQFFYMRTGDYLDISGTAYFSNVSLVDGSSVTITMDLSETGFAVECLIFDPNPTGVGQLRSLIYNGTGTQLRPYCPVSTTSIAMEGVFASDPGTNWDGTIGFRYLVGVSP